MGDDSTTPPRYIENKAVDHAQIQDLLSISAKANQWSNFGPLCHMLEAQLAAQLDIPPHLAVVACSNATVALHTLVSMHEHLRGRPLRWVTCAFGFYSSCDGVLHSAEFVDCNPQGLLDLDLLNPDDFDGFIVTNIFGQTKDLAPYQRFAEKHQKILLTDSAMDFQSGGHIGNECISLHHTKPWGFGEGGCAIVEKEHAALFRDMLAFGHMQPSSPINRLATNGKISDIACAYLIMRLQQSAEVRRTYLEQFHRIASIGRGLGLGVLGDVQDHPGIPANVPFLFDRPTELPAEPSIPARKYYFPLDAQPVAQDIYQRIINVACHTDMARIPDAAIKAFLESLLPAR